MSEEIEIQVVLEIDKDIDKSQIAKTCIDIILDYEESYFTKKDLVNFLNDCVINEFYNYAESIKRPLKCIDVIFE